MVDVLVYSTSSCPFCVMAFRLLDSKGLGYDVVDVGQNPELWAEMESKSGRQTVPQIFIGDHHVGGFDDLSRADSRGEIESLLKDVLN
ncbi:glutaredoxin 3 [hydrothermal vent metagenome]|uniref:Glutaredoxin 3 n=1 Tax=hydrothermal vent metagenome TaxID=652676 RepID=A0A3B0VP80_9ZZZZ